MAKKNFTVTSGDLTGSMATSLMEKVQIETQKLNLAVAEIQHVDTSIRANVKTVKRVKFTTALDSEVIEKLKIRAIQEKTQPNEIIEKLLKAFLND
jgi:hypothetical protein